MVSKKVVVKNPTGLHLKPAAVFCKEALNFQSTVTFTFEDTPALMDPKGIEDLEGLAEEMGIPAMEMSTGASHDAQIMSLVCPSNMILIPSQLGPADPEGEFVAPQDLINGYTMLKAYLRKAAW